MIRKAVGAVLDRGRSVWQYMRCVGKECLSRLVDMACYVGMVVLLGFAVYGFYSFMKNAEEADHLTLLVRAAYHNKADAVTTLLDMGLNPNVIDETGNTALDVALFREADEAVQVLLDAGAEEGLSLWRRRMRVYEQPLD